MTDMIKVYSKRTGRPHNVPEHYLDNPHLMAPFTRTAPKGEPVDDTTPSLDWSAAQLRKHAADNAVPLTGVGRSKAAILEAIQHAAQVAHLDPEFALSTGASDPVEPDTSSGTASDD